MDAKPPLPSPAERCRNCGQTNLILHSHHMALAVPEGYPLSGEMSLARCLDCGFAGNLSPSGPDDYVDYYTHYNKHQTRTAALHDLDEAYFSGVLDLIERETGTNWPQMDVLDWGSGALLFSRLAEARGARSANNYDLTVDYPDIGYGLIASTHCIEHVLDFNAEFRRIHGALADNGLFLIAVPNLRGYNDVYWGPYAAFDLEHINHFDIDSLSSALERAGFDVVATRASERLVTPTLAYPEILILARKREQAAMPGRTSSRSGETAAVLARYIDRAERDLSGTINALQDKLSDYDRNDIAVSAGVYGVASYAFRLIRILADEHDFHFSWIADSDSRLTGKKLDRIPIQGLGEFEQWVARCESENTRCVAFIAAVNAARIATFLEERFGTRIEICVLPPDCQNRASNATALPA